MIRYSTLKDEGPLNVSKWIKLPLLIDVEEMVSLLHFVKEQAGPFWLFNVQGVMHVDEGILSPEAFLDVYREYIAALQSGEVASLERFNSHFSYVLSMTEEALYAIDCGSNRRLLKACLPVVQMQPNRCGYSLEDQTFRTQVYGQNTFSWGMQLGYPHVFQNPKTLEVYSVHDLPNTPLFGAIQKWVRSNTRPTPFLIDGQKKNEPIRLGKACFAWINQHSQLREQNISVEV